MGWRNPWIDPEGCLDCGACLFVCPVNALKSVSGGTVSVGNQSWYTPGYMKIDVNECIECTACVPECPYEAIYVKSSGGSGSSSPPTGGGGSNANDLGLPLDVKVDIKNPCLAAVYNKISSNLNNNVTKILTQTFGQNSRINLNIVDLSFSGAPAKALASNIKIKNGIKFIDVKLTLNTNGLPTTSQEYIATTILHEIIHAYLDVEGANVNNQYMQHLEMGKNFVNDLRDAIQDYYSITDAQANSLILYGMGDIMNKKPDYYNDLLANYNLTAQNVYDTAQNFKNNTNGMYCN